MKITKVNSKVRGKSKFLVKTLQFWEILIVPFKWIYKNIEITMTKQNFFSKLNNTLVKTRNKLFFSKNMKLMILDKAASMITSMIKCLCQNEKNQISRRRELIFKAFYCFSFILKLNEARYLVNDEFPLMNERNIKIYKKWIEKIIFYPWIKFTISQKNKCSYCHQLYEKSKETLNFSFYFHVQHHLTQLNW